MKRVLAQTILGIVLSAGSIYCIYLFITSIDAGENFLILIPAFVLLGLAVYLFFRAGKADDTVITKETIVPTSSPFNQQQAQSSMDKKNELIEKYHDTSEKRDRLKLIGIAAGEQKL